MSKKIIIYSKPEGVTPHDVVLKIKSDPKYKDNKIGYAGRLDPMASGIMIFLLDEENKNRKLYEKLSKTYEFEVLFGVESDTYDILGVPSLSRGSPPSDDALKVYTDSLVGKFRQEYPPYSSPKVKGKPLFWWAREGKIDEITIPSKIIQIYSASFKNSTQFNAETLLSDITKRIALISGDFRQELIVSKWKKLLNKKDGIFKVASFEIDCSSGTYIRSIAKKMGLAFEIGAIAYRIKRSRVGGFNSSQSI